MGYEVIRSRQNKTVKLVCSLSQKKAREESGLFRFDGIKLCCEALRKNVDVELLVLRESNRESVIQSLLRMGVSLHEKKTVVVGDDVFDRMSEEKSPEGIITVAKSLDKIHKIATINNRDNVFSEHRASERMMLLEAIRDPGNLGTVIRSAASLGMERLVLSYDCADLYNPRTIRAAMGALFTIRVDVLAEGQMPEFIRRLRESGRRVFAAALRDDAVSLNGLELRSGDCFVIGNEGHGLEATTIEACESSVMIPMCEGCESLNAATAASIFIWETSKL